MAPPFVAHISSNSRRRAERESDKRDNRLTKDIWVDQLIRLNKKRFLIRTFSKINEVF